MSNPLALGFKSTRFQGIIWQGRSHGEDVRRKWQDELVLKKLDDCVTRLLTSQCRLVSPLQRHRMIPATCITSSACHLSTYFSSLAISLPLIEGQTGLKYFFFPLFQMTSASPMFPLLTKSTCTHFF